jgi:hypothetical protein
MLQVKTRKFSPKFPAMDSGDLLSQGRDEDFLAKYADKPEKDPGI